MKSLSITLQAPASGWRLEKGPEVERGQTGVMNKPENSKHGSPALAEETWGEVGNGELKVSPPIPWISPFLYTIV